MSSPYLCKSEDSNYTFTTDNGVHYVVYFIPGGYLFGDYPEFKDQIIEFGINMTLQTTVTQFPADPRVGATVRHIVMKFFEENPHGILFYTINEMDNRQSMRNRLFSRWFSIESSSGIKRMGGSFKNGTGESYAYLLYQKKNPHDSLIVHAVEDYRLYSNSK